MGARIAARIVLLSILVSCATVSAQQTWYAAYEDGLAAIKRQDWTKAEQLLKAALQRNPRQGRRVLFYGTRREDYIPEYYLAVVYVNQQRDEEALALFEKVERAGLVAAGSREYPELQKLASTARLAASKRVARADDGRPAPGGTVPPAASATPTPVPGDAATGRRGDDAATEAARANAERRDRFATLLSQAANDLTAGRFDAARSRSSQARALAVDSARVDDLDRRIEIGALEASAQTAVAGRDWAEAQRLLQELQRLDAGNTRLTSFNAAITRGLADAAAAVMRSGLRAFFSGDYQTAIRLLEPVAASAQPSPRALLYLACSQAALALLEGPKGDGRLQKGRQLFARARGGDPAFATDRRFISPGVLRALEAPGR